MPTQSPNYQLWTGMQTDDFVQPAHVDRLAATVDHTLGSLLRLALSPAVHQGWEIQSDQTVSAGCGRLGAGLGITGSDQAISGLAPGAVNYIYAAATTQTAPAGEVSFVAQTHPGGPAEALYLGTLELDAEGETVEVDNHAEGAARGAFFLRTRTAQGAGVQAAVQPEETVEVEIEHEALLLPGAVEMQVNDPLFAVELVGTWQPDRFTARITNTDTVQQDLEYSWRRWGVGAA